MYVKPFICVVGKIALTVFTEMCSVSFFMEIKCYYSQRNSVGTDRKKIVQWNLCIIWKLNVASPLKKDTVTFLWLLKLLKLKKNSINALLLLKLLTLKKGIRHFLTTFKVINVLKELHHFLTTLKVFHIEKRHPHCLKAFNTKKGLHHFLLTLKAFNTETMLHHFLTALKSFNIEKGLHHFLQIFKISILKMTPPSSYVSKSFSNSYSVECWWTAFSEGRLSYNIYD